MNIGLIGYGYWGPVLASCFQAAGYPVTAVADRHPEHIAKALEAHPHLHTYDSADALLEDPTITAVVIALPTKEHAKVCEKALLKGKHVLVEKPFTYTKEEAARLIRLAAERGLTLMVDHHFIYKDSFRELKTLLDSGRIGTPRFADSARLNLGLFRRNDNVVWDLIPHDLSILQFLLGKIPHRVSAKGVCTVEEGVVDTAHVTLDYDGGFTAHIHLSWAYPCKVRSFYIGGDGGVILHDDNQPTDKMTLYGAAYEKKEGGIACSRKDPVTLSPDTSNALANVAAEFVHCMESGDAPLSDGLFALQIVHTMEAIQWSMKNGGEAVPLTPCPPVRNILCNQL